LDTLDLQRLDESLVDARRRGQALWLEATAYEFLSSAPDGRAWIDAHKAQNLLRFRDAKHEFRYYKFE
jgi:hypothetical protein